jgi:hypothetical protein
LPDGGEPAADRLGAAGRRHGVAAAQILADQQRVDLRGGPAQRGGLVVERQQLGLDEVGRRQDRAHAERL